MKDIVFNEVVSGRRVMVEKHNSPWDYYTGYIQLYPLDDPAEWIKQVNDKNEDYFDKLDEFSNFPYGVTYAGNLNIDGEWWVGFDTASAPLGSVDEEDCIDALKATALILKIRSNAVKDAVSKTQKNDPKDNSKKIDENVGILLELLSTLALANAANDCGYKDTVEDKLRDAGTELFKYLVDELGMDPADIILYGWLKDALNKGEEDEENE